MAAETRNQRLKVKDTTKKAPRGFSSLKPNYDVTFPGFLSLCQTESTFSKKKEHQGVYSMGFQRASGTTNYSDIFDQFETPYLYYP